MTTFKSIWKIIKEQQSLILFSSATLIIYAVFFIFFNFSHYTITSPDNIYSNFIGYSDHIIFILLLLFQLFITLIFYKYSEKFSFKALFVFFIFIGAILLFVFPIGSSDIYAYIYQGRVMAISHLNPFVTTYKTLISDSFYHNLSIMQSTDRATPYGPLFVIISAGLCSIFKYNLIATIFSFKLFFFLITILCAYLVYRHFGKKAFYLLAFNPLLLFELIVNGHNESLVILFILLTFIFFKKAVKNNNRTYYLFSFAALMAAILIKYTALLILPFFYLLSLHNISTTRQRLKYSLSLFLLGSLMIILSYLPFDLNIFKSLKSVSAQSNISSALLCSPLILFFRGATHYLSFNNYNLLAVTVSRLVFLFFYIYLIGRARISQASKDPNKLTITFIKFSTLAFVGICASFFTWFMPWYLCSLLLTLIIFATNPENSSRQEKLLIASIYLISIYGLLFYFFLG